MNSRLGVETAVAVRSGHRNQPSFTLPALQRLDRDTKEFCGFTCTHGAFHAHYYTLSRTISQARVQLRLRGFHAYKSVAPLKLCARCVVCFGSRRFHAYKSVAPLKPSSRAHGLDSVLSFHAYKSVAPLKPGCFSAVRWRDEGFHAYKSVAPLKLHPLCPRPPALHPFPRLQKRGLVRQEIGEPPRVGVLNNCPACLRSSLSRMPAGRSVSLTCRPC